MNKTEAELFSIRTSIEAYKNILKEDESLTDAKRDEINKHIMELETERDKILFYMLE